MPREDYGDAHREGNKLVPAALTAYRHFYMAVDPQGGVLLTPIVDSGDRRRVYDPSAHADGYRAQCLPYFLGHGERERPYNREHPMPSLECTCGFYAHYFPGTDFYRDNTWAVREDFTRGGGYQAVGGERILVRAVVEVSGRVVAGDLGVRAEKMKIKALAIDWEKALVEQILDVSVADLVDGGWIAGSSWFASVDRYRALDRARDHRIVETLEACLALVAQKYGVEAYSSHAMMYADFPQQDLSALGINAMTQQEADERKRRRILEARQKAEEARQKATTQVAMYADQFQVDLGAVADSFAGFTDSWVTFDFGGIFGTPAAKQKKRRPTGMPQDVRDIIAAKRNRPAPPGTGIDFRRKKL